MPSTTIVVDVAGESAGVAGQSRTFPYSKISGSSPVVTLSLSDTTGITSYFWEIVSKPVGSSAALSNSSAAAPTFSADADVPGTYLIRCTVNGGQSSGTIGVAFLTALKGLRKLAAGETVEFDSTRGWATALNETMDAVEDAFGSFSGTLDSAYDGTGGGAGKDITADGGAVSITVPNGSDSNVLELVQNDETNSYSALKIDNNAVITGMGYTGAVPQGVSILLESAEDRNQTIWCAEDLIFAAGKQTGVVSLYMAAISPVGSQLTVEANSTSGRSQMNLYCNSASDANPAPGLLNIGLTNDGIANAQLSLQCTSTDGDAEMYINASNDDGSGTSFIHMGSVLTESIRFGDANMRYSSWTQADSYGKFFELSASQAEWNDLRANYGEVSLIAMLNSLVAPAV